TSTAPAASEENITPAPTIKIVPAQGGQKVRPDRRIVVTAADGALQKVTVTSADGKSVIEGRFEENNTRWVSTGTLRPSTRYTVTASAEGQGGTAQATSEFRTLTPARQLQAADVTPAVKGEKVGVGAPIIVTFNQPVANKAAVERALKVEAEKPVEGAWRWVADNQVIYRTAKFWPAHQKVTLNADLTGVRAAKDMYGVEDTTTVIRIGARQISTVDTRSKTMIVKRDGKVVQKMLISAGKATTREYTTTSGIHLTMEKANPVR